jgi:hypothetical protein
MWDTAHHRVAPATRNLCKHSSEAPRKSCRRLRPKWRVPTEPRQKRPSQIMLERQREGIAKAKAAGKYKGRPVSIDAAQIRQLRAELGPAATFRRQTEHHEHPPVSPARSPWAARPRRADPPGCEGRPARDRSHVVALNRSTAPRADHPPRHALQARARRQPARLAGASGRGQEFHPLGRSSVIIPASARCPSLILILPASAPIWRQRWSWP